MNYTNPTRLQVVAAAVAAHIAMVVILTAAALPYAGV